MDAGYLATRYEIKWCAMMVLFVFGVLGCVPIRASNAYKSSKIHGKDHRGCVKSSRKTQRWELRGSIDEKRKTLVLTGGVNGVVSQCNQVHRHVVMERRVICLDVWGVALFRVPVRPASRPSRINVYEGESLLSEKLRFPD